MTIDELYDKVWLEDIPNPICPEYVEHHESIQRILGYIKEVQHESNSRIDTV